MSATLTWAVSGSGTKTGITITTFLDDLDTLITSKSGDASFYWEKAGKNSGSTPYYLLLRRKSGSAGRIAIIHWSSSPAANNVAILDATPTTTMVHVVWFPNGTGTTLSNLTAASGTICGNDTNCTKVVPFGNIASLYAALFVPFYFDSAEGIYFGTNAPAGATTFLAGVGDLVVDAADTAYGAGVTLGTNAAIFGGTAAVMAHTVAAQPAGTSTAALVRTNYGSANRVYFQAFAPSGAYCNVAVSSTDILTNTAANQAWFPPVQLLGTTKGEGMVLKLRQMTWGPGTVGPYTKYLLLGVQKAVQVCAATTGGNGFPWLTDFK